MSTASSSVVDAKSACGLLLLDCFQANTSDAVDSVLTAWSHVDNHMTTRILIRHCPDLRMTPEIQLFPMLQGLKIYNSTIVEWNEAAALTNTKHPKLSSILLARVNFSEGVLTPGFLSSDFPRRVDDIELCITNLQSLPDGLDSKWSPVGNYFFEYAHFKAIPLALLRLHPLKLSLAGNQIDRFPVEIFQQKQLRSLNLAMNSISTLATVPYRDIDDETSLTLIVLAQTNVSSLPRWLDRLFNRLQEICIHSPVLLFQSPFCDRLRRGGAWQSSGIPDHELSLVTNLSAAQVSPYVECDFPLLSFYPIEKEDG